MSFSQELRSELVVLRRGRGLQQPALIRRIGTHLRELSGIVGGGSEAEARERVRVLLTELAEDLPDDLRRAIELTMAFAPGAAKSLTRRIGRYATQEHCSERTARRRMDEAIDLLVRTAAERHDPLTVTDPGSGWRVRSFTSLLRLDTPTPELYETRVIVPERQIEQIEIKLDVPPTGSGPDEPADSLTIDAIYGVRLAGVEVSGNGRHYRLAVILPDRLEPGQQIEFCLHYRVPAGQPIRNHCAIVPFDPCDAGRVRVRFGTPPVPAAVWRLTGVPPRQMDRAATEPGLDRLQPDGAGEVTGVFRNLRQGHGYGVAWR